MIKTLLFDFDGVIADTEPIYDQFWNETAQRYNLGIPNFAAKIKGTIMPNIMKTYFSHYSPEQCARLQKECDDFEDTITYSEIPGALRFIEMVKQKGMLIGLVTSSTDRKIKKALPELKLENAFDTIVTADQIIEGKPSPQCYLLAAQKLQTNPSQCLVFEDSFAGIEAGQHAGMKVIALSTTNSAKSLQEKNDIIIPNFQNITWEDMQPWIG